MSSHRKSAYYRLALACAALFLSAQVCGLPIGAAPTPPAPDPSQVAQLITIAVKQTQLVETSVKQTLDASAPSPTPVTPTETPTLTPTWTPTFTGIPPAAPIPPSVIVVVVTATPGAAPAATQIPASLPKISAHIDSNCRAGPAPAYKRLGYLLVGETSEVYGRNRSRTWWYIREPRRAGIMCWVWSGSTTVEGNASNAPIVSYPTLSVTKTPAKAKAGFSILAVKMIKCGGEQTVMVRVKNTGNRRLESAWLRVYDLTKGQLLFGPQSSNNPFRNSDTDCSAGGDRIDPGETRYLGAGLGSKSLSNRRLQVDVQMCTGEGLSGQCYSDSATYRVP